MSEKDFAEKAEILWTEILRARHCVAFTGAGVSTLSGIQDFRGKKGLYKTIDADRMFDIDVFRQDPSIYYKMARDLLYDPGVRSPSLVHNKLASLGGRGLVKAVITQNVDLLHTRAGSKSVYEIHGSPATHSCVQCGFSCGFDEIVDTVLAGMIPKCARCGGTMKPNIVFFGENLPEAVFAGAMKEAGVSDLMLVLGSSLVVYPAASIPETCLRSGGKIIIVNDLPTHLDREAFLRFEDLETVFSYIDGRLREGE